MNTPAEKLFEVPRIGVLADDADPTVLKIAFSGSIEFDRSNVRQVDFYNALVHGQVSEVTLSCHVAGAKKIHRRDSEGDVDAIVETKSLVVDEVFVPVEAL